MEQLLEFIKQYKKNKSAVVGFIVVVLLLLTAFFAPIVAPYKPDIQNLADRLIPPMWDAKGVMNHVLGTDDFGRDLFSRIIFGSRISLMVGAISVGVSLSFGLIMGIFAAYFGGKADLFIMRIVDIMLSIPAILLAIVIVSILGPSLFSAMTAIGIVGIPTYARIVRASVLAEREKEYVIASRINGSSNLRLMFVVILPNCASPIIVQATMGFASAVLEAAGLSFLGLGAQPPTPEWGAMLSDSLQFITTASWMIFYPGIAIFLTVLSFNLMGDGLMDVLDPKLKDK